MKKFLENLYKNALELNRRNICSLLKKKQDAIFLDLGCDDGTFTIELANVIGTKNVFGVDVVDERIRLSVLKNIKVVKFDLNEEFKFDDEFFDVINANQVLEHLFDLDNFISEIYRILKPLGYVLISTENACSWCNIIANILGWQSFSLTNISKKRTGVGNPLALHKGEFLDLDLESWKHISVYSVRGIRELFEIYGFELEDVKGAGYFPLPAFIGNFDKTHSHFITLKFRKKLKFLFQ